MKAPDPGEYYKDPVELEIKKIAIKEENNGKCNRKNDTIKIAKEAYYRDQNKPSIPGRNEKFGYTFVKTDQVQKKEEAFRNFNPDVLAGDIRNSVGPGEYNPKKIQIDKHVQGPVLRFSNKNSRFKDEKTTTNKNIGPGAYNILDSVPNYKFKPSSTFLSTAPKCLLDHEVKILKSDQVIPKNLGNPMDDDYDTVPTTIPGPGSYYNSKRDTSFNSNNKNHKFQLFNSSVPRFPDAKWNSFIGPGTYEAKNMSFQIAKLSSNNQPNSHRQVNKTMVIQNPGLGFNSVAPRDYDVEHINDHENQIPGPGTYDNPYDMARVIEKKVEKSRKRRKRARSEMPLGSNKENMKTDLDNNEVEKFEDEAKLGPGSYYMAHANPKRKKESLNATFLSNVSRFNSKLNSVTMDVEKEMPPVGQYEQNYYDINKGPRKSNNVSFNTGARRFKPGQTISDGDIGEGPVTDFSNETKYKFTAAFGGGFRGGLSIDARQRTGKNAPFGSVISRFNPSHNKMDTGDFHVGHANFDKRSYNILYV